MPKYLKSFRKQFLYNSLKTNFIISQKLLSVYIRLRYKPKKIKKILEH